MNLSLVRVPKLRPQNPATAVKAALGALGVQRVSVITPYNVAVTQDIVAMLEKDDFKVTSVMTFNEEVEAKVARITPQSILATAVAAGQERSRFGRSSFPAPTFAAPGLSPRPNAGRESRYYRATSHCCGICCVLPDWRREGIAESRLLDHCN